jgi:hypothetical protein
MCSFIKKEFPVTIPNIAKHYKCCETVKIPKQECKVIKGRELRRGRICAKEMMLVKYNNFMGFVKLSDGRCMNLSEQQLSVFEKLISGAEKGQVYVYIADLRSDALSLCKVFQNRANWRSFIETTKNGFYRLKLYADEYKLKYDRALRDVKKRKATGELLNKKHERFR